MKTRLFVLLLGLLGSASAALVEINVRHDVVVLKGGRRLEKVFLGTYDTRSGKIGAVVGGRMATTLRLGDLPDEIAGRIRERIPALTEDEAKAEQLRAAEELAAARRRAEELEKRTVEEARTNREVQRKLDVKLAEDASGRAVVAKEDIAAAARELATYYFTYEADPYSSAGYVFDSKVLLEDPEPVPGWENRWRVRGRAGIRYLTRDAGAVGRNSKEFELLIEAPPNAQARLLDVTISRL